MLGGRALQQSDKEQSILDEILTTKEVVATRNNEQSEEKQASILSEFSS